MQAQRRRRRLWYKIVSALACVVVFCTTYALILPGITLESQPGGPAQPAVSAVYNVALYGDASAAAATQVDLPENAHILLQLTDSADSYQWQIRPAGQDAWVDIYGDNGQTCEVYYAKLKNMLANGESAQLRAVATRGGAEYVSGNVNVTVQPLAQAVSAAFEGEFQQVSAIWARAAASALAVSEDGETGETVETDEGSEGGETSETDEGSEGGETGATEGEANGGDTPARYTVRVRYLYDTGAQAADPWWGTFSATGETGAYKVTFPIIQGYKVGKVEVVGDSEPPVVERNTAGNIVALLLPEKIDSDVSYNVIYTADFVNYTVNHWRQDVSGDGYDDEPPEIETKRALTGTLLTGNTKEYEGFTAMAYAYPTAAADGSTVINIYYDRNYYKITFDLGGGTGVSDIYVRYGAGLPGIAELNPTRTGYTFEGWYLDKALTQKLGEDENKDFPATMPAQNTTYYAKWKDATSSYTVAVWVQDLNDTYGYLTSTALTGATNALVDLETDAVQAYLAGLLNSANANYQEELQYFTLDEDKSKASVRVAGDGSAVLNVYYSRNSYTLRFVYARSTTGNNPTYQMSLSNNGYSLHNCTSAGTGGWREASNADRTYSYAYDISYGCNWTNVTSTPAISTAYQKTIDNSGGVLTTGSYEYTSNNTTYTYYYIDLTAQYGANIHDYWPRAGCVTASSSGGTYSLISWGTDYASNYRTNAGTTEPNISPYYDVMDKLLVYDATKTAASNQVAHTFATYTSDNTIYYWTFNFYYEALSSQTSGGVSKTIDNKEYTFVNSESVQVITTQGNHSAGDQSVPSMMGYEMKLSETGATYRNDEQNTNYNNNSATNPFILNVYYTRERYTITFHNGYGNETSVNNVPYGESLASYKDTQPPAVTGQEAFEAKWVFSGEWYTAWNSTDKTVMGDQFDLTTATMPQNNLILYAKWVPKTYTATFFWESPDSNTPGAGTPYEDPGRAPQTFNYGSSLAYPGEPKYGSYEFLYWTYYVFNQDVTIQDQQNPDLTFTFEKDEPLHFPSGSNLTTEAKNAIIQNLLKDGYLEERRLSFDTTVFYEDVYIYGHWNNIVYIPYTVHYVLLDTDVSENVAITSFKLDADSREMVAYDADENRVGVQIAEDSPGSRLAGITVTVNAKMGTELYKDYQGLDVNGLACYPVGSSTHSLTMDINKKEVEYTFVYKKANPVDYKVQYLAIEYETQEVTDENGNPVTVQVPKRDSNGNLATTELQSPKVIESTQAIVTEDAPVFPGYSLVADPDTGNGSYQVTRILTYAEEGVVTPANTITFYYVQDDKTATYHVEYYLQQIDGTYKKSTDMELLGAVNAECNAAVLTFPGWWYNEGNENNVSSGTVSSKKTTVLKLYYNACPLTIQKQWDSGVNPTEVAVSVSVYLATQNGGGASATAVENATVTLNEENRWQHTLYLPALEAINEETGAVEPIENQFYAVVEDTVSLAFYPIYKAGDSRITTQIFLGNTATTGGKVTLTQAGATVVVVNLPTYELPETGAAGTRLYTVSGAALVAAAALLYKYQRRRRAERRSKQ